MIKGPNPLDDLGAIDTYAPSVATIVERNEPPYDGSEPCPVCPLVVRLLYNAAVEAIDQLEATTTREGRAIDRLEDAVRAIEPLILSHFARKSHAFPATVDSTTTDYS